MRRATKWARVARTALTLWAVAQPTIYAEALAAVRSLSILRSSFRTPAVGEPASNLRAAGLEKLDRHIRPNGFDRLRGVTDKFEYMRIACSVPHPLSTVAPHLPAYIVDAIDHMVAMGGDITAWRLGQAASLDAIAESLRPFSAELLLSRPQHLSWVGGPNANPAFECVVIDALGLPNVDFVYKRYVTGSSIVGEAPRTGLWKPRTPAEYASREPTISARELHLKGGQDVADLTERLELRFTRAVARNDKATLESINAAWKASQDEVSLKGSADGPLTKSQVEKRFGRFGSATGPYPVARHAVLQGDKYRPVDDGRPINAAYRSAEKVGMMHPTFTAGVARAIFERHGVGECPPIGASHDDEPNAYRWVSAAEPEFQIAALVSPRSGKVHFFALRGHAFGFGASVPNYCEKPTTLCIVAAAFFAAPVSSFVDDFTTVETLESLGPEDTSATGVGRLPGSAHSGLWTVARLFSSSLSEEKSVAWATVGQSCGVVTDLSLAHTTGEMRLRIKDTSRAKALAVVKAAKAGGRLNRTDKASLRGKLGYIMILGVAGRAALQPLADAEAEEGATEPAVKAALSFVTFLLEGALPDFVFRSPAAFAGKVTVFTDASWKPRPPLRYGYGCIGFFVIRADGSFVYASAVVPQAVLGRLMTRKTFITPLETMALCGVYHSLPDETFAYMDVNHFADNTAANGATCRGYSPLPDISMMVGSFHLKLARLSTRPWIEWVESEANIADLPSRPEDPDAISRIEATGATRVEFVFPQLATWGGW